jgi:hypothetical protein
MADLTGHKTNMQIKKRHDLIILGVRIKAMAPKAKGRIRFQPEYGLIRHVKMVPRDRLLIIQDQTYHL